MAENEDKNEFQNHPKTEKKLFEAGGKPGPGRGNTRKKQEISKVTEAIKELLQNDDINLAGSDVIDLVARVLLYGTTLDDNKIRIDSARQYNSLLPRIIEAEERERKGSGFLDAESIQKWADTLAYKRHLDVANLEIERLTQDFSRVCSDCKKKLGIDDTNNQC